jgi:hypothetical protein
MASYFIFGAIGTCPSCADHRFSGPMELTPESALTCHRCGHVCSAAVAAQTGLGSGKIKKLSDHRVVG